MPQGRQKSPGSFQDELGGLIDRVAPREQKQRPETDERGKRARNAAELNDRLFENAWRKDR